MNSESPHIWLGIALGIALSLLTLVPAFVSFVYRRLRRKRVHMVYYHAKDMIDAQGDNIQIEPGWSGNEIVEYSLVHRQRPDADRSSATNNVERPPRSPHETFWR